SSRHRRDLLQPSSSRSAPVVVDICSSRRRRDLLQPSSSRSAPAVVVEICSSRRLQDTPSPDLLQLPLPRFGETVMKVSGDNSIERVS
ncbi:hypothetical protein LINPERHAP1_LOCUS31110, partial [Linum perenne]